MTPDERLARRVSGWFGLDLARGGRLDALARVLARRAEATGARSADAYVDALEGPADPEVERLLETVTVGHTWFFRDPEQFEAITAALCRSGPERPRPEVWVAGCSTGEDAYTVALLAQAAGIHADVLGTDVNPRALERARAARYAEWSTHKVPAAHEGGFDRDGEARVVGPSARRTVRFAQHNLLDAAPAPSSGAGWDLILCRNVLIYFSRGAATRTVERLAGALRPGGWLFLGASEVIRDAPSGCVLAAIGSRFAIHKTAATPAPSRAPRSRPKIPAAAPVEPPEDTIARALGELEAGRSDEAVVLCAGVLEAEPLRVEAHLVSGMAFHLGGDPESAARALSAAVLLDPQLWPAFFYLGQALEKLGRTAEAAEAYRQAGARADASPARRLAVLDAYKSEIAALARERSRKLAGFGDTSGRPPA